MTEDRRKHIRSSTDRRREARWELPWWGYVCSALVAAALLAGFLLLIYR